MSKVRHPQTVTISALRSWRVATLAVATALVAGLAVAPSSAAASPTIPVAAAQMGPAGAGTITTFAGGTFGGVGDGRPAVKAPLSSGFTSIHGVGVDRSGNVYVAKNPQQYSYPGFDRVRRIDALSGVITTAAGTATQGLSGDSGLATQAQLSQPSDMAFDGAGNMYVLDGGNQRIRKVSAGSGIITTVAGGGNGNVPGFGGDGGPATKATLALFADFSFGASYFSSTGLAVDRSGNLFIADQGNDRIRRVDGRTGTITSVAGGGTPVDGLGDGGPAISAAFENSCCGGYNGPNDIAIDQAGNLYITESNTLLGNGSRVRRVDAVTGIITTVAGGGSPADGLGDNGPATSAAIAPQCVDFDQAGNLVICDNNNGRVRRVDRTTGIITTIAGGGSPPDGLGDGGPATSAAISLADVTYDALGNLYVTDIPHRVGSVRKVDAASGIIHTIAGGPNNGDGGPASSARLSQVSGVATATGKTYVSDAGANLVRLVDASGTITTAAGGGSPADGLGDGGPATAAALGFPRGLAVDGASNLFIVDDPRLVGRVRRVDGGTGIIATVAGGGSPPDGVGDSGPATSAALSNPDGIFVVGPGNAKWPSGTLFIAECPGGSFGRVRRVDPPGRITTVAGGGTGRFSGDGGPATRAGLGCVTDVVVDSAGNLLIADAGNSRVRRVDARSDTITTVAGDGAFGLGGEGGPAMNAHLNNPQGVVLDPAGNLYISDNYKRVVKVDWAGVLTRVAGTGALGFGGDGGPALAGEFQGPGHMAFDAAGNLLITDVSNGVREVHPGVAAPPAGCGEMITTSTTLTADLGPCPGAGIIVGADNITLNLNGHRIFGAAPQNGQYPGIMVSARTGVTVTGGQVDHFSAGVAIVDSTGTTVKNMMIRDNVGTNDLLTWADGIVLFYSGNNTITGNHVIHNGVYDNIGVFGRLSDHNLVKANTVTDSTGFSQQNNGVGINISFNAFAGGEFPDRGASLVGNQIIGNTVLRAYANGISNRANTHAQIIGNMVNDSGLADPVNGVGIGVLKLSVSTPTFQDLVQGNTVHGNQWCGIQASEGHLSRFIANIATGNGLDPIFGGCMDLQDDSPPCPNVWLGNTYGTASPCTTTGGHHVVPPLALAGSSSAAAAASPNPGPPNPALRRPATHTGPPHGRTMGE